MTDEQLKTLRQQGYEPESVVEVTRRFENQYSLLSTGEPYRLTESPYDLLGDPYNARYYSADDVDNFLNSWARQWPSIFQLKPLPNKTWGNGTSNTSPRNCAAALLSAGNATNRKAVFVSGGVHAREWVAVDVCINFLYFLATAYNAHTGLNFVIGTNKGKAFTADQIKAVLERLQIIVFPNVNPDGRIFSQEKKNGNNGLLWRKNRRSFMNNFHGVDLNRNFDFLWQYKGAPHDSFDIADQLLPGDELTHHNNVYKGPFAFSEPETRNMQFILQSFSNIEYFVDVHTNTHQIYYAWGDAPNGNNKWMAFSNSAYDSIRGQGKDYQEYMLPEDDKANAALAQRMVNAISLVRCAAYSSGQSYSTYVPTVATSDDYALSLRMLHPNGRKIHTFTLECAVSNDPNEYTPGTSEVRNAVIYEVCAGLIDLCCAAAGV